MSHGRITGQLQNSITLTKVVYGNQLGSIENGSNGSQIVFYTNEGIPTSTSDFTISQSSGNPTTVNVNGDLSVTNETRIEGTFLQGSGANGETTGTNTGSSYLAFHNMGRHVEVGADTVDHSYIDFHSKDINTTTRDFDTRILSVGGETGSDGGGTLSIWAKNTLVVGPDRLLSNQGYDAYPPGLSIPSLSQYRDILVQKRVWSGTLSGTSQTALVDAVTGIPLVGKYNISMGNGPTSSSVYSYDFYLLRRSPVVGVLNDYTEINLSRDVGGSGTNKANLYALVTQPLGAGTNPVLSLINNTGTPAKYMIIFEGFVDNNGY